MILGTAGFVDRTITNFDSCFLLSGLTVFDVTHFNEIK
jgi:hypothetical protein